MEILKILMHVEKSIEYRSRNLKGSPFSVVSWARHELLVYRCKGEELARQKHKMIYNSYKFKELT